MAPDNWLAEILDVFFNGRPARTTAVPKVTVQELVRRKTSHILLEGKLYRIEVREVSTSKDK
jgi:hypothetical protein